jgi:GT2 family glycosyltransferase
MRSSPRLSVIVAVTPRDHEVIHHTIQALADQSVSRSDYEVLVVDADHTRDREPTVRRIIEPTRDLHLRYIKIHKRGRAASHNKGIQESSANLLLFLADDFVPTRALIQEHLKFHETYPMPNVVAIGPALFSPHLEMTPFMRWLESTEHQFGVSFAGRNPAIPTDFFYGANTSLKKDFLVGVGLFDEDFPYDAVDDYEMGLRLFKHGMKTVFLPRALAYHDHQVTLEGRRSAMRRAGTSTRILDSKYPSCGQKRVVHHPSTSRIRILARWSRLKFFLMGREQDRDLYFRRCMTHAFLEGYERCGKDSADT